MELEPTWLEAGKGCTKVGLQYSYRTKHKVKVKDWLMRSMLQDLGSRVHIRDILHRSMRRPYVWSEPAKAPGDAEHVKMDCRGQIRGKESMQQNEISTRSCGVAWDISTMFWLIQSLPISEPSTTDRTITWPYSGAPIRLSYSQNLCHISQTKIKFCRCLVCVIKKLMLPKCVYMQSEGTAWKIPLTSGLWLLVTHISWLVPHLYTWPITVHKRLRSSQWAGTGTNTSTRYRYPDICGSLHPLEWTAGWFTTDLCIYTLPQYSTN